MSASPSKPLAGVKVVEFCQVAAGPFCGMLLADYGAEVVKVEPPEGDAMRQWPPVSKGYSENFASINRGKRSVALDLKDPGSRDFARALALEADVVIENNRPASASAGTGSARASPRSSIARSPHSARRDRARPKAASTSPSRPRAA
jgi:crotonobetainyl-CoA:carnitine CoA-transferase CaiB-like acyl-CoA transferase